MEKRKAKAMNKKAMFFTILAIALLFLFLASYTLYSVVEDRKAIQKRIETLNNFVFSIEQDLPRQLYVSGFRAIFLSGKRITDTGGYIDDSTLRLEELLLNGTIYGTPQPLMKGANLSGIQDSLNEKASKINANVALSNPSLAVSQEDPWHVKFALETDLAIKDNTDLASWNRTTTIATYVPIENFIDPIYFVNTGGEVPNKINKTPYTSFVTGNDVSNLTLHVENSLYLASARAPSFLNRLEGNLSADENGIESLVYLPDLTSPKSKSVVDYIYFSADNPVTYGIDGMPSWFKLDNESSHLDVYGVEHLAS